MTQNQEPPNQFNNGSSSAESGTRDFLESIFQLVQDQNMIVMEMVKQIQKQNGQISCLSKAIQKVTGDEGMEDVMENVIKPVKENVKVGECLEGTTREKKGEEESLKEDEKIDPVKVAMMNKIKEMEKELKSLRAVKTQECRCGRGVSQLKEVDRNQRYGIMKEAAYGMDDFPHSWRTRCGDKKKLVNELREASVMQPTQGNSKKHRKGNASESNTICGSSKESSRTWGRDRVFTPLGDSYEKVLEVLVAQKKISGYLKPPNHDPTAKNYNAAERCTYHSSALGHSTERCWALKHKIQDLIDTGEIVVEAENTLKANANHEC